MSCVAGVIRSLDARMVAAQSGQTLAEYVLVVAVIAVVVIVAAMVLGGSVSTLYSSSAGQV